MTSAPASAGGGTRGAVRITGRADEQAAATAIGRLRGLLRQRESLQLEAIEVALRLRFHQRRRSASTEHAAAAYLGPRERRLAAESALTIAALETRRLAIQQRLLRIERMVRVQRVRAQQHHPRRRSGR